MINCPLRALSSMAEHSAHNRMVIGSNPIGPKVYRLTYVNLRLNAAVPRKDRFEREKEGEESA